MIGTIRLQARRYVVLSMLLAVGSIIIAGCKKQPEITRYQVLKEKLPAVTTAQLNEQTGDSTEKASKPPKKPGQDRMLAAIVPHGEQAWFFKLAGNGEAVGKHVEAFDSLVQSVTFPDDADGKPEWKQPEEWKKLPGNQFRFATLVIPADEGGKPLEVTVTTLPWRSGAERNPVLENVNRWRGQIALEPLKASELDENTRKLKLADDGEAIVVDLKGTLADTGMRPPFATRPGGTEN